MDVRWCEKCHVLPAYTKSGDMLPFDYCAMCGTNLCRECGLAGHCGAIPAISGMYEDGIRETLKWGDPEPTKENAE